MPTSAESWPILDPDVNAILQSEPRPLEALASGRVAAIVVRRALDPNHCQELIARLIDRELLFDPQRGPSRQLAQEAIPEGHYSTDAVADGLPPTPQDFFNTQLIHEVPGVAGELPRVVMATFIGHSANEPDVFVWS